MERFFLTCAFIVVGFQLSAQGTASTKIFSDINERVFLHVNSNDFLAGENLFYAFYAQKADGPFSDVSKVGYIELLDPSGKVVIQQKVLLDGGKGSGDFFIPTSFETGLYTMVAYTKWMLNLPASEIYKKEIAIINPFKVISEKNVEVADDSVGIINNAPKIIETGDEMLLLNGTEFTNRQNVEITIPSGVKGKFSLSVRKVDEMTKQLGYSISEISNSQNITHSNTKTYLPELRGEIIEGKIKAKDKVGSVDNRAVSLSIPGESFLVRIVATDSSGMFRFILDEQLKKEQVVVQVLGDERNNFQVILDPVFSSIEKLQRRKLRLSPGFEEEIKERSIAIQIENAYYQHKQDSIVSEKSKEAFYSPLAKDYVLDDYTRFPTLSETIIEIIPEMYFSRNKGSYSIHLRDYSGGDSQALYGQTLVMVDGLVVQDAKDLFAYPANNIYKISIINQGYIYGPKIFNGVVNVITKSQDYDSPLTGGHILKTEIPRPVADKIFYQPDYANETGLERIPDFRNQLLWIPELSLLGASEKISFFTSDVSGTFQISLEGFSSEGKPISIKKYFSVE